MLEDQALYITQLITLFAVLDPPGHLPLFLSATADLSRQGRRRAALLSILISFAILLAFAFGGQFVLHAMGVSLLAFQISGGIIIFVFALTMVLGEAPTEAQPSISDNSSSISVAVYPLAVPIIAGPGSILTMMVLMDNNRFSFEDHLVTIAALITVLTILMTALFGDLSRAFWAGAAQPDPAHHGPDPGRPLVNLILSAIATWLKLPPI